MTVPRHHNDNATSVEPVVIHEADHGIGYAVGLHPDALIVPTRRCAEDFLARREQRTAAARARPP